MDGLHPWMPSTTLMLISTAATCMCIGGTWWTATCFRRGTLWSFIFTQTPAALGQRLAAWTASGTAMPMAIARVSSGPLRGMATPSSSSPVVGRLQPQRSLSSRWRWLRAALAPSVRSRQASLECARPRPNSCRRGCFAAPHPRPTLQILRKTTTTSRPTMRTTSSPEAMGAAHETWRKMGSLCYALCAATRVASTTMAARPAAGRGVLCVRA
mmetsp:Transcript_121482/g.343714  ORF Transcript_121482/g.343714 Transcript_121482/m.343714 type:complete len:213 (+) Transcript_121482:765-1403(+)